MHVLLCLSCGLIVMNCDDSTPVVPQEDGVFMISLKPSYREGDEIEIFVINQTDIGKMFLRCGASAPWLYRLVEDQWENVSGICTENPPQFANLPVRSSLRVSPGLNVGFSTGEYRVGANVCDEGSETCEWVFSEPFKMFADLEKASWE